MANTIQITIRAEDDASVVMRRVQNAAGDLRNEMRASDSVLAGVRSSWMGVTAALTAAVGASAGAIALTRSLVNAASDMNETTSKTRAVFKEATDAVMAWSQNSAEAFGLSSQEALSAASDFGNMFAQLGIGRGEAAKMSKTMVELAADFASFHNADIRDVLIAQAAAFRGEYDSVQRFVPIINAAAVEEAALQLGLAKTTKELTAQDKALAAYTILIDQAGDAAGDFQRTSEGLANEQRTLRANIDDLRAALGTALEPAVRDVVAAMNDWMNQHGDQFARDFAEAVDGAKAAAQGLWQVLKDIYEISPIKVVVDVTVIGADLLDRLRDAIGKLPGGGDALKRAAAQSFGSLLPGATLAPNLLDAWADSVRGPRDWINTDAEAEGAPRGADIPLPAEGERTPRLNLSGARSAGSEAAKVVRDLLQEAIDALRSTFNRDLAKALVEGGEAAFRKLALEQAHIRKEISDTAAVLMDLLGIELPEAFRLASDAVIEEHRRLKDEITGEVSGVLGFLLGKRLALGLDPGGGLISPSSRELERVGTQVTQHNTINITPDPAIPGGIDTYRVTTAMRQSFGSV